MPIFYTRTAQKLRALINEKNSTLGTTQTGADWCLKALHPSDPLVEVRGIPDKSAIPSVMLNYQTIERIKPPADSPAGTTWAYNSTLVPHPVLFAAHQVDSSSPTTPSLQSATLNAQIDGATHPLKFKNFRSVARRWRLAYASATIIQDGPDLANQGTIVVAQVPIQPAMRYASFQAPGVLPDSRQTYAMSPIAQFSSLDFPDFASSQGMPNAYFNSSKLGAYIPLKLTKTCQQWHSSADSMLICPQYGNSDDESQANWDLGIARLGVADVPSWPFIGLSGASVNLQGAEAGTTAATIIINGNPGYPGYLTSALCNDVCAQITAQNMAVTTSLQIFYRFGFEMQVLPQTMFSPQQKISPPHDSKALKAYFAISRELKDAYPEDYNSLGKILKTIGEAANLVSPALDLVIPGSSSVIKMLGNKAIEYGGSRKGLTDKELQTTVSAATLEDGIRKLRGQPSIRAAPAKKRPAVRFAKQGPRRANGKM